VFDALHRGFLRSLQISITENADQLSNVLELYTYTFHYKNPAARGDTHPYSGVEMTGPGGVKVTVRTARTAMTDMVRSVVDLCGTMPRLPESRFVRLHLFYNENVPKFYEPEGFAPSTDHAIFFPEGTCQKVTVCCGEADAGFHTVCLKVSHLRADDAVDNDDEDELEDRPPQIPSKLAYRKRVSRLEDIEPARVTQPQPNGSHVIAQIESTNELNTPMAQQVRLVMARPGKRPDMHITSPSTVDFTDMDLDLPLRMNTQCPGIAPIATLQTAFEGAEVATIPETSAMVDTPRASTYTETPFSAPEELVTTKGALQQMVSGFL
jgi:meiosis-specific protein HOP1